MKKVWFVVGLGILLPLVAGAYGSLVSPVISSLSPLSGQAGTLVTINGSGFTACLSCENRAKQLVIRFGTSATISVMPESDSLATFTIPNSLTPTCPSGGCTALQLSGTYTITVINQNGITSNPATLTVIGEPEPVLAPYPTPYNYPTPVPTPVPTSAVEIQPVEVRHVETKQTETKHVESKTASKPEASDEKVENPFYELGNLILRYLKELFGWI